MAVTDHLLRTQMNEVFEEIRRAGLDPGEFVWSETYYGTSAGKIAMASIFHRSSGYCFSVPGGLGFCRFSPGGMIVLAHRENSFGWPGVAASVREWLQNLTREITTPDLWASVQQEKELAAAAARDTEDNRPFTPAEQERIAASLREVRDYLLKSGAYTAAQLTVLNSRLDYLESASTRVGRKDWVNLAVATLTNIVVLAALPGDRARELFRVAGQALRWLLRGQGLLP